MALDDVPSRSDPEVAASAEPLCHSSFDHGGVLYARGPDAVRG